jgi:hypothetical protein
MYDVVGPEDMNVDKGQDDAAAEVAAQDIIVDNSDVKIVVLPPPDDDDDDDDDDSINQVFDGKTVLKKRFQTDLRTIRESPETVYSVSYFDTDMEEVGLPVPDTQSSVDNSIKVDIEEVLVDNEGNIMAAEGDGVLRHLNERADKLSQELKELTKDAEGNEGGDQDDQSEDFKEIMRQYSDFIIIIRSDESGNAETIDHTDITALVQEADSDPRQKQSNAVDITELTQEEKDAAIAPIYEPVTVSDEQNQCHNEDIQPDLSKEEESVIEEEVKEPLKVDDNKEAADNSSEVQDVSTEESISAKVEEKEPLIDENASEAHAAALQEEEAVSGLDPPDEAPENGHKTPPPDSEAKATEHGLAKPTDEPAKLDPLAVDEALEMIRNFKPKRPQEPTPQFPDLCLAGEKSVRARTNGSSQYWRMPFRQKLFADELKTAG